MNYYSEWDPFAAAWLRELIKANLIPNGVVDTRSICDISSADLKGYTQCHFFAGIGGWSLALRLAGWPDDRPVWTGSCPCQAFSSAGKGEGFNDPRHLWPVFNRLISECRPPIVFGEQVEAAVGHGWLDLVATDLEAQGYAFGTAVLGAHSCSAPHRRQRIYWVGSSLADAANNGRQERAREDGQQVGRSGESCRMDSSGIRPIDSSALVHAAGSGQCGRSADGAGVEPEVPGAGHAPAAGAMELPNGNGRGQTGRDLAGRPAAHGERPADRSCDAGQAWSDSYWLPCRDGKARQVPVERDVQSLVDGLPGCVGDYRTAGLETSLFPLVKAGTKNRVGLLRGAGNAICVQTAEAFIRACG